MWICVITNKTNKRLWKTSYSKYISNTLKHLFELSRKLKQLEIVPCSIDDMQLNECDLIHIPNLGRGSYPRKKILFNILFKPRISRIPIVVTLHGFDSAALRSKFRHHALPSEYASITCKISDSIKYFLWQILKYKVRFIITPSLSEKKNLINLLRIPEYKITVIYHGVDHSLFKPIPKERCLKNIGYYVNHLKYYESIILHVSHYQAKKNIERIIASYSILKKIYHVKVPLVIVGKHPIKRLYKFIYRLGLKVGEDIIFTGLVPESILPCLYSLAKVFVFPSLHESFGMPALEAMACGTPVIVSNRFSLPEIVGTAGIYVDPLNIKELAKAIYKVLNDEETYRKYRALGINRAKHYSWRKTALQHLIVYKWSLNI